MEHGFSVTQIREPFSAGCLACEVTNGVPKPCDAELVGESNFSQRTRPPRRVRVVSSCFRTAPLTRAHTCSSSTSARRPDPLSAGEQQARGSAPTLPTAQRRQHAAARAASHREGTAALCSPTGVAIKIPIVCVVLEGGPGTLDVRNCSCLLPAELKGGGGGRGQAPCPVCCSVVSV